MVLRSLVILPFLFLGGRAMAFVYGYYPSSDWFYEDFGETIKLEIQESEIAQHFSVEADTAIQRILNRGDEGCPKARLEVKAGIHQLKTTACVRITFFKAKGLGSSASCERDVFYFCEK